MGFIIRKNLLNTILLVLIFVLLIFFVISSKQLTSFESLRYVYTSRIVGNANLVRSEEEVSVVLHQQKINNNVRKHYQTKEENNKLSPSIAHDLHTTSSQQPPTTAESLLEKSENTYVLTDPPPQITTEQPTCEPVQNVVFIKTHKTGSSTILNILQRFSDKRNLSMALPSLPALNHHLGWPHKFKSHNVFEYEGEKKYDIFANHARYQRSTILDIMRDPTKTKFVTILRDPLFQLESSAVYLRFDLIFNFSKQNIVDGFLNKVERDKQEIWNKTRTPKSAILYLIKNPNAFDLGFRTWAQDHSSVMKVVDTVEKEFNLVMISDYMMESLVLLKDELCWDLEDVVFFTLNKRPKKYRQAMNNTEEQRKRVRNWNHIDYELFDHFNQTFWQKIKSKGERFQRDVNKLREMNKALEEKCIDHGTHYDKTQPWFPILGYKIKEEANGTDYYELCKQMCRSEIDYNNVLREKQSVRNWTKPIKKKKGSKKT